MFVKSSTCNIFINYHSVLLSFNLGKYSILLSNCDFYSNGWGMKGISQSKYKFEDALADACQ